MIAGQWYDIHKLLNSKTLATEVVKDGSQDIMFKLRQQYTVRVVGQVGVSETADSLVSLMLGEGGR
jgi:hypothetical protein